LLRFAFSVAAFLHKVKLTDPQIAHIAYSAGQIDIQAAQLALKKSKNKECGTSPRTWYGITRR
jgi:putative membrane protein